MGKERKKEREKEGEREFRQRSGRSFITHHCFTPLSFLPLSPSLSFSPLFLPPLPPPPFFNRSQPVVMHGSSGSGNTIPGISLTMSTTQDLLNHSDLVSISASHRLFKLLLAPSLLFVLSMYIAQSLLVKERSVSSVKRNMS